MWWKKPAFVTPKQILKTITHSPLSALSHFFLLFFIHILAKQEAFHVQDGSQIPTKLFDYLASPLRWGLHTQYLSSYTGNRDFCHQLSQNSAQCAPCSWMWKPSNGTLFPTGCPVWGHHGLAHNSGRKSCSAGRQQLLILAGGPSLLSKVEFYIGSTWVIQCGSEANLVRFTHLPKKASLLSVQSAISSKSF